MENLLHKTAHDFTREDFPVLYALIVRMIEEGKPKDEILAECAKAEEVDGDVLNSVEMTIDYLVSLRGRDNVTKGHKFLRENDRQSGHKKGRGRREVAPFDLVFPKSR